MVHTLIKNKKKTCSIGNVELPNPKSWLKTNSHFRLFIHPGSGLRDSCSNYNKGLINWSKPGSLPVELSMDFGELWTCLTYWCTNALVLHSGCILLMYQSCGYTNFLARIKKIWANWIIALKYSKVCSSSFMQYM